MGWLRALNRRRVTAMAIVLVVEALIILALISLNLSPDLPRKLENPLIAFDVGMPKAETTKVTPSPKRSAEKPVARPAVKKPLVILPRPLPGMVVISSEDFAASDISKLPKSSGGGGGSGTRSAYGPGEGPGGKTLYPAEWYVEPPHGALAAYLPEGAPEGSWAMIACQTVERYHVENCYGLGQSQQGLSTALRRAAWQFLVRPPRVDGKPLVGAWVRIRFDFTKDAPG